MTRVRSNTFLSGIALFARSDIARRLLRQAAITVLLAHVLSAIGCAAYTPAKGDRLRAPVPAAIPEDQWPARETADLEERVRRTPQSVHRYVLDGTKPEDEISPRLLAAAADADAHIDYAKAIGQGIIRVVRSGGRNSADSVRFVSYSPLPDQLRDKRADRFMDWFVRREDRRLRDRGSGVRVNDREILNMLYEGTRVRLIEPPPEKWGKKPVRGIVVHLAGLGSLEWEQPVIDRLLSRGWAILRIATPRVWWYEATPFECPSMDEAEAVGKHIATVIDDLLAEPAYATEAALEYLAEVRPDLPTRPLAVLGFSAGSLVAPTVVARTPEKYDAAILVGCGANLLEISQTSDLTDGGITLTWPNGEPSGCCQCIFDSYLRHSVLDPYHTASCLTNKPTLVVDASFDSTVPAKNGEMLYRQLGKPDRFSYLGGHRLLFWSLKNMDRRIADWLENAVAKVDKRRSDMFAKTTGGGGSWEDEESGKDVSMPSGLFDYP